MAFVHGSDSVFKLDNGSGSLTDVSSYVNNVDFPPPFGPTTATFLPLLTEKETLSRARVSPY